MKPRYLNQTEQLAIIRLLEVAKIGDLQGRPKVDYIRAHFLANNHERDLRDAVARIVRVIANQSQETEIVRLAKIALDLLSDPVHVESTIPDDVIEGQKPRG